MVRKQNLPKKPITFTEDVSVLDHNGDVEVSFKAGQVVELSYASANRWIKRQKAIIGGKVKAKVGRPAKPKLEAMKAEALKEDTGNGKADADTGVETAK